MKAPAFDMPYRFLVPWRKSLEAFVGPGSYILVPSSAWRRGVEEIEYSAAVECHFGFALDHVVGPEDGDIQVVAGKI